MTDKQQTIVALTFVSESSTAAIAAITTPPPDPDPSPLLVLVLADLDSLLALVYNTSTKLSLALKPAAPAYSASIPLLNDLAQHVSALAHCTHLLRDGAHGATFVKHVRHRVAEIIEALRALVQTFLNNAARGPKLAGSGASGEEYLVRTGALHDLIANARGPSGIPKDNRTAVHNAWKSDGESLDDNLREMARLVKDAESPHDDTSDGLDDGWDEIGLGSAGTRLDKDELARAKNVHTVLRLTTLLHKHISLDLLAYPSSAPVSVFDSLLGLSNELLSTSDDLVAALYAPQDVPYVRQEVLQLVKITTSLQTQIILLLPVADQLSERLNALAIDGGSTLVTSMSSAQKRADKKWFDTCVDQILRLCTIVSKLVSQTDNYNNGT